MVAPEPSAADLHLPWFFIAPEQTDILLLVSGITLIVAVLLLGVLFFWLHSLPERLGHKKLQFEIVAVLGLISLFTHIHLFWVIGLVLALIELPDFTTPLQRIAASLEKLSGSEPPAPADGSPTPHASAKPSDTIG